jgi:hypothetical protein
MPEEWSPDRLRSLWQSSGEQRPLPSAEEVHERARAFERRLHFRNLREYAAAALGAGVFTYVAIVAQGTILLRLGCALCVAGLLYVAVCLHRRGSPRPENVALATADYAALYRRELERQRDLLHGIWRWYLGPLIPGMLLFLVSVPLEAPVGPRRWPLWVASLLGAGLSALVFLAVARLNQQAVRRIAREIETLPLADEP